MRVFWSKCDCAMAPRSFSIRIGQCGLAHGDLHHQCFLLKIRFEPIALPIEICRVAGLVCTEPDRVCFAVESRVRWCADRRSDAGRLPHACHGRHAAAASPGRPRQVRSLRLLLAAFPQPGAYRCRRPARRPGGCAITGCAARSVAWAAGTPAPATLARSSFERLT